jgi:hypothetical protein
VQSVANANGKPKLHANCYGDSNSHGDGNGHCHSYCNCYVNTQAVTHGEASPDTKTSSDTAAAALNGTGRLIVHRAAGIDAIPAALFLAEIPGRNPPHAADWRAAPMRISL